ncbi:DUF4158 domain-containing protein [Streptomyces mirabilis]|uniref:DUF4158 domain-containing protein n=1 Tax=Streptomyces mirabilis TaxID=68239 RepID=UPI003F4CB73A
MKPTARRQGAGVRQEWSPEDVVACWTLVDGDWDLVANKSGPTRLGFCLMLKFFEIEGRFPEFVEEFPQPAVEYVAGLVKRRPKSRSTTWRARSGTGSRFARHWCSGRRPWRTRNGPRRGCRRRSARSSWSRTGSGRPCWCSAVSRGSSRRAVPVWRRCWWRPATGGSGHSVCGPSSAWATWAGPGCWRW